MYSKQARSKQIAQDTMDSLKPGNRHMIHDFSLMKLQCSVHNPHPNIFSSEARTSHPSIRHHRVNVQNHSITKASTQTCKQGLCRTSIARISNAISTPISPAINANPSPPNNIYSPPQSPPPSSPLPSLHRKRRRMTPPSRSSSSETITGHVLSSGKFKCSHPDCADEHFNRHADFRRHYSAFHEARPIQYFCSVSGCLRSREPSGRSKGRSFGPRKDKMEEHMRTVHHKGIKKKKYSTDDEDEE